MRKTKLLLGSAILSVALLGTGYAYWTDALTVNTTVGTGNFEVTMQNPTTGKTNFDDSSIENNKYMETVTGIVKNNIVTLEFNNMYPGAQGFYTVEAKNTGTIAAVIDNFKVTLPQNPRLMHKIKLQATNDTLDTIHTTANFTPSVYADTLEKELNAAFGGATLEPNQTIKLIMEVQMDTDVINLDRLENQKNSMAILVNWKQHNAKPAPTAAPTPTPTVE